MHILVVDDEQAQRDLLAGYLKKRSYTVSTASSGKEAIEQNKTNGFDLVILDLKMPEIDGIETMTRMKEIDPQTFFIILTGFGTVDSAVEAMKIGAFDYLGKPVNLDELEILIERVQENQHTQREIEILRHEIDEGYETGSIIAESRKMKEVLGMIARVAKSDSTVLIQGESGTGKEVVARLIHRTGIRKSCRFVPISCAALPETLLESELFGYERGAFTGADKRKIGKFELADKGTLFLDEIGDLPLTTQVKLLRVLQEFTFERLGGTTPVKVNVRLISATNQDLRKKVAGSGFREDLLYRLNVITVDLAPLRERKEDIRPLADHFIQKFRGKCRKTIKGLSTESLDKLLRYTWPGNIRELENVIERAVVLCRSDTITVQDLPLETGIIEPCADVDTLRDVEAAHIKGMLEKTDWNLSETSKRLGIHRNTLRMKIKEYKLTRG